MTMVDIRERFEVADRLAAPDLWDLVQEKVATADARSPRRLRLIGEASDAPGSRRAMARKLLTIAAALLIAVTAIGLLLRAFRAQTGVPVNQPPSGIFAPVQGWIVSVAARSSSKPPTRRALSGLSTFRRQDHPSHGPRMGRICCLPTARC